MRKVSVFLSILVITIFTFSFVGSANAQSFNIKDDSLMDLLYDGLNPGEKVVDFHREIIPMNEFEMPLDSVVLEKVPSSMLDNEITPFERTLRWFPMRSQSAGNSYSSWMYAGASSLSGGVLHASHTNSVSNDYSGELKVTINDLEGLIGFNTSKSYSATVGYSTKDLPVIANKGHRLEYRHVYKQYKVTQERKYDRNASQVYGTAYVYPMQWAERQYRVVEFNK